MLEFTIKSHPEHDGVTTRLHSLEAGTTLLMSDSFGSITWEGPGVFLAGGAGLTPFLAILRQRWAADELGDSELHFSNSTPADVICEKELRHMLGDGCHLTCTRQSAPGYDDRRIDRAFLEREIDDFSRRFYVYGPPEFVESLQATLLDLGAAENRIVVES